MTINQGVRRLVERLNASGFITTDSGDGVTNVVAGIEGAMTVPNVTIVCHPDSLAHQADRLFFWLKTRGVTPIPEPADVDDVSPCIRASYDPADQSAVIVLTGVDDSMVTL